MKRVLFAGFLLSMFGALVGIVPLEAGKPQYLIIERLALPDSILPPGYVLSSQGALPENDENPIVTTDPTLVGFISHWFTFGVFGDKSAEKNPDMEAEMNRFRVELSACAKAGYVATYLPGPGKGGDEIGIMALIIEPWCTALDKLREGIIIDNAFFLRADTLAVCAITDLHEGERLGSILEYYEQELKK